MDIQNTTVSNILRPFTPTTDVFIREDGDREVSEVRKILGTGKQAIYHMTNVKDFSYILQDPTFINEKL